jgi:hypothetical protein
MDRKQTYLSFRTLLVRSAVAGALLTLATPGASIGIGQAHASPNSEVASALDGNDRFDLHATLRYESSSRDSSIRRERVGLPGTQAGDQVPVVNDLVFSGFRHELVPALELGIFHDLWLSAAMPLVLHDSRTLSRDSSASTSSTIDDGILPTTGFDARDPNGGGFTNPGSRMVFRGPNRRGTTQLHLGLGYAAMNQERDPSKPTWKLGAQIRLPIGKVKKLNRFDPGLANGSSEGITHVRLSTSFAKKIRWAEPQVEFWWQAPLSVKDSAPLAPLDQTFGASNESPQQEAATRFAVEATLWENPADDLRVGLELSSTLKMLFSGRGYSDMWEVFQYAGYATENNAPLVLDREPTVNGVQGKSHPGVTNIENFMTLDTVVRVTADVGEKIRFSAGVGMQFEQGHLISFADAGEDFPLCSAGQVGRCETDRNDLVNAGTAEVNPLHVPLIDLAGHRYRVAEGKSLLLTVNARILF